MRQVLKLEAVPLHALNGRHRGELIFVIGNSASLLDMDWKLMLPYTTIGVNRILELMDPTYLLVVDKAVMREQWERMQKARCQKIIYNGAFEVDFRFRYQGPYYSTGMMTSHAPLLGLKGDLHLCPAGNTAYEAVQIAYRMGAREIALAGVDLYWPPAPKRGKPAKTHFFGDGKGRKCHNHMPVERARAFQKLGKALDSVGVRMYSVSVWKTYLRKLVGYKPIHEAVKAVPPPPQP